MQLAAASRNETIHFYLLIYSNVNANAELEIVPTKGVSNVQILVLNFLVFRFLGVEKLPQNVGGRKGTFGSFLSPRFREPALISLIYKFVRIWSYWGHSIILRWNLFMYSQKVWIWQILCPDLSLWQQYSSAPVKFPQILSKIFINYRLIGSE